MEVFMNLKQIPAPSARRPFWQQSLYAFGVDTAIVLFISLLFRDWGLISNLYFISSFIFLVIASIPILSEMGTSVKLAGRAVHGGEKVGPLLKEKQGIFDRGARTTYIYGLAGLVMFILSILTTGLR
jgi:hypothetical protein